MQNKFELVDKNLARMNYYQLLGVATTADSSTITKAYRTLSLVYHPDRYQELCLSDNDLFNRLQTVFKLLGHAYSILMDVEKRANYDQRVIRGIPVTAPVQHSQSVGAMGQQIVIYEDQILLDFKELYFDSKMSFAQAFELVRADHDLLRAFITDSDILQSTTDEDKITIRDILLQEPALLADFLQDATLEARITREIWQELQATLKKPAHTSAARSTSHSNGRASNKTGSDIIDRVEGMQVKDEQRDLDILTNHRVHLFQDIRRIVSDHPDLEHIIMTDPFYLEKLDACYLFSLINKRSKAAQNIEPYLQALSGCPLALHKCQIYKVLHDYLPSHADFDIEASINKAYLSDGDLLSLMWSNRHLRRPVILIDSLRSRLAQENIFALGTFASSSDDLYCLFLEQSKLTSYIKYSSDQLIENALVSAVRADKLLSNPEVVKKMSAVDLHRIVEKHPSVAAKLVNIKKYQAYKTLCQHDGASTINVEQLIDDAALPYDDVKRLFEHNRQLWPYAIHSVRLRSFLPAAMLFNCADNKQDLFDILLADSAATNGSWSQAIFDHCLTNYSLCAKVLDTVTVAQHFTGPQIYQLSNLYPILFRKIVMAPTLFKPYQAFMFVIAVTNKGKQGAMATADEVINNSSSKPSQGDQLFVLATNQVKQGNYKDAVHLFIQAMLFDNENAYSMLRKLFPLKLERHLNLDIKDVAHDKNLIRRTIAQVVYNAMFTADSPPIDDQNTATFFNALAQDPNVLDKIFEAEVELLLADIATLSDDDEDVVDKVFDYCRATPMLAHLLNEFTVTRKSDSTDAPMYLMIAHLFQQNAMPAQAIQYFDNARADDAQAMSAYDIQVYGDLLLADVQPSQLIVETPEMYVERMVANYDLFRWSSSKGNEDAQVFIDTMKKFHMMRCVNGLNNQLFSLLIEQESGFFFTDAQTFVSMSIEHQAVPKSPLNVQLLLDSILECQQENSVNAADIKYYLEQQISNNNQLLSAVVKSVDLIQLVDHTVLLDAIIKHQLFVVDDAMQMAILRHCLLGVEDRTSPAYRYLITAMSADKNTVTMVFAVPELIAALDDMMVAETAIDQMIKPTDQQVLDYCDQLYERNQHVEVFAK